LGRQVVELAAGKLLRPCFYLFIPRLLFIWLFEIVW